MEKIREIIIKYKLSIFAVTETWLTPDMSDGEINIDGYRLFRRDRVGRLGGGVCIYTHHCLKIKVLNDLSHPLLEMLWLSISLSKRDIVLGCLYRPPDASVEFWSTLDNTLEVLEGSDIILMGDLNVNTLDTTDRNFAHLKNVCLPLQLKDIVQSPTRISPTTSKCLDVILTNKTEISAPAIIHLDMTDHALVLTTIRTIEGLNDQSSAQLHIKRNWRNNESPAVLLENALSQHMHQLQCSGINSMWKEWKDKFLTALDEVAPKVTALVSYKRPRCPWMTPQLLNILHRQKSIYRKILRSNRKDSEAIKQHRLLRSQSTNLYRLLKNQYFQQHLAQYRNNPRNLWSAINHVTGRRRHKLPPSAKLSMLTEHFKTILRQPGPAARMPFGPDEQHSFKKFRPVTTAEVELLLSRMASTKAPGPDTIRPSELKLAATKIASSVSVLFNESLATGELPQEFKEGNIIPIFKLGKTDTTLPSNYRGITLNCVLSKVLERIVYDQISEFLNQKGALNESQYGFRKQRSCPDLLLTTVDDWLMARDAKLSTAVVFIDLSKAFDNVQHQLLLHILQQHGVGGIALAWFFNYLQGRTQQVVLQSTISDPFECSKGVPQGSVLGPLLFNLYVSDLPTIAEKWNTSLPSFADDMTLYCSRQSATVACEDTTTALDAIHDALAKKGLEMNSDKTVAMVILPRKRAQDNTDFVVHCQKKAIQIVSQTRLLGIIVDEKLSWSAHVDGVCSKVGRKIGALRRSFRQLTPAARRLYLLSVIQPDLEYAAATVITSMSATQRSRLKGLWRKAVRCFSGASWKEDVSPILRENSLTPIDHRWALQVGVAVRRCQENAAPSALCGKLHRYEHSYITRGKTNCFRPYRPATYSGSVCFSNIGPLLWNALPAHVRQERCPSSFKVQFLKCLSKSSSLLSLANVT